MPFEAEEGTVEDALMEEWRAQLWFLGHAGISEEQETFFVARDDMLLRKPDHPEEKAEELRRSVHDMAATIVAVRALAETLAEHVPTLVTVARSNRSGIETQIPAETLDAMPLIPGEILELCKIARTTLQTLSATVGKVGPHASPARLDTPADSARAPATGAGSSILLVEDEDSVRYVLSRTLESKGFRVIGACDGEEALDLLEEQQFDLILMDLRIPGLSGAETVKRIREREATHGRHTRIVGLTASPLVEDQQRAKAAGMDDVLVKPIDERALQSLFRPVS